LFLSIEINFNRYAVVDVIFYVKFLQTLNCFAVKRVGQKIRDEKIFQLKRVPMNLKRCFETQKEVEANICHSEGNL